MMKTFSLPFGKSTQTVSLDEAHVLYDLHGTMSTPSPMNRLPSARPCAILLAARL